MIKKACGCFQKFFLRLWKEQPCLSLSDLALGQQREVALPAAAHPAGPGTPLAQLHTDVDRWWGPPCLEAGSHGDSAHPSRPLDSPEPSLPCLESARQRNQVFSQADPCHPGPGSGAHKGPPVPRSPGVVRPGLGGGDLVSGCLAGGALPPPFFLPPLSLPPVLAQLHPLQVSKANG